MDISPQGNKRNVEGFAGCVDIRVSLICKEVREFFGKRKGVCGVCGIN